MKNSIDILSQLQRIHYRYEFHNKLISTFILEILETYPKQRQISPNKLQLRREQLQQFNKEHNTSYGITEFLYLSFLRWSYIKESSFEKVHQNVTLLTDIGFSKNDIMLFMKFHIVKWHYFKYSYLRNQKFIKLFAETLGRSKESVKEFIQRCPRIFGTNIFLWYKKMKVLIDAWFSTKAQMTQIVSWYPRFHQSSEKRLLRTIEVVKQYGSPEILCQYPVLFYCNPDSEFFHRVVKGLCKNHKTYQKFIEKKRLLHWNVWNALLSQQFAWDITEKEYLADLKKWYKVSRYDELKNTTIQSLIWVIWWGELRFLEQVFEKILSKQEVSYDENLVVQKIAENVRLVNQDIYNQIVNIMNFKYLDIHKEVYNPADYEYVFEPF